MDLKLRKTHLYATLAFIWLLSLGMAIDEDLEARFVENFCTYYTNKDFQRQWSLVIFKTLIIWCIPNVIMAITYYKYARVLKANSFKYDNNREMQRRNKQNAKFVKMFAIIVIVFFLLTMPYAVFHIYFFHMIFIIRITIDIGLIIRLNNIMGCLFAVAAINGCINPLIYAKMDIYKISSRRRTGAVASSFA